MKIDLEGCKNARDLGGILTNDRRKIKSRRILRTGNLSLITERDVEALRSYGLKKVIDMRTQAVINVTPNVKMDGVEYIHVPIVRELDSKVVSKNDYESLPIDRVLLDFCIGFNGCGIEWMKKFYNDLVSPYGLGKYRMFFDILKENTEGSVIFHCTAGKDRTGVGAILLLTLLDVPRDEILKDYLRTNESVSSDIEKTVALAKKTGTDEKIIHDIPYLNGVDKMYADIVFERIDKYPSPEEFFLKEMNIDAEYIKEFRSNYLE
ncbi:MAG: tyrosine-protein phosphatase [Clostridia bacterium]|nr:tyrosine-protein phosphatase [Clostridia bacterium]